MASSLEQDLLAFRQAAKPFLALSKLDDAVQALLGLVQREKELKDAVAALLTQKQNLEAGLAQMTAGHESKKAALAEDAARAVKEHAEKLSSLKTSRTAADDEAKKAIAELEAATVSAVTKKAALDKDYANAVTTMKIKFKAEQEVAKRAMHEEIDKLKATHDALVNELKSLKGRIAAA